MTSGYEESLKLTDANKTNLAGQSTPQCWLCLPQLRTAASYAIFCGSSYLAVEGSKWYTASGVQPNDCH